LKTLSKILLISCFGFVGCEAEHRNPEKIRIGDYVTIDGLNWTGKVYRVNIVNDVYMNYVDSIGVIHNEVKNARFLKKVPKD